MAPMIPMIPMLAMMPWLSAAVGLALLGAPVQDLPSTGLQGAPSGDGIRAVRFEFKRPSSQPPHWAVEVNADGAGRYDDLSATDASAAAQGPAATPGPAKVTTHAIRVGPDTLKRLILGSNAVRSGTCETRMKNIADTGAKHIAYRWSSGDSWSQCDFNYSDDAALNDVAKAVQGIVETMQTGERLKHNHRFSRLGLDAELDNLSRAVKDGRALEVQNIAPVLQSLVDDDDLMSVVRRKAQKLLQDATLQLSSAR
jgi:hypothetical protein